MGSRWQSSPRPFYEKREALYHRHRQGRSRALLPVYASTGRFHVHPQMASARWTHRRFAFSCFAPSPCSLHGRCSRGFSTHSRKVVHPGTHVSQNASGQTATALTVPHPSAPAASACYPPSSAASSFAARVRRHNRGDRSLA